MNSHVNAAYPTNPGHLINRSAETISRFAGVMAFASALATLIYLFAN